MPALKVGAVILGSRRGRRMLLAIIAGVLLSLAIVVITLVSSVGAVATVCQRESEQGVPPSSPTSYVSQEPSGEAVSDIPSDYLSIYRSAAGEYGLDWAVLAAVGKIETDHGRLDAPGVTSGENSWGAGGPMQFLASTWASVGVDGNGDGVKDRYDPEDAIPGAANYLKLEGAPEDYQSALFAYNHAQWYVDDVLAQAEEYRAADEGEAEMAATPATIPTVGLGLTPAYATEAGTVGNPGETVYSEEELGALDLINTYRKNNGLGELQLSDRISSASAYYAHDMAKYDSYGVPEAHITGPSDYYPEGADLVTRMNTEGYSASSYGENIAAGQESAEEVFEAWRNSPPHNAMMLNVGMNVIGIGLVENPQTSYGEFWATNFGSDPDDTTRPVSEAGGESSGTSETEGGSVQGNEKAVFPLPKEFMDSYEDTWGAARGHGGHEGTDMFAPDGTPIYSITSGTVVASSGSDSQGWNELGGWTTMVEASESVGPVRAGDMLYYAHQVEPSPVSPGETVEAGDVIGRVGSTGEGPPGTLLQPASRGQHLHLGWYDPSGARAEAASGAMNPYPLLEWLRESGGIATGNEAAPSAPGVAAAELPSYCTPFVALGLVASPSYAATMGTPVDSPGDGEGASPTSLGSGRAAELLADPNFEASSSAIGDLESGVVDDNLVSVLQAITSRHQIYVSVFKTGHPYGATLPASLGGGYNSHYYGLTADISEVDGKPVAGNGTDPDVLDIGRIVYSIPVGSRPDEVIGPSDWTAELGYDREDGFITDIGFTEAHYDHIHLGQSP
ncbi:CAP domain-containing protein [Rubrobacter indicoceani]|uniref:CAP domain-containing protein n=1 Tax=Rubrobacter indicoceani TaxID=2051957 RepID=UPI0013C40818|nr:CAP domain-containing protein [Rubrobacter indicoceani]